MKRNIIILAAAAAIAIGASFFPDQNPTLTAIVKPWRLVPEAIAQPVNRVPSLGTVDITGSSQVNTEGQKRTYAASAIGIVPASSATDIACLTGSATTTVKVTKVGVSGTAGTLITLPVTIRKNASVDTGGTPVTSAVIPVAYRFQSTDAAATAAPTAYTANPTIADSAPGKIAAGTLSLNTTSALVGNAPLVFQWGQSGGAKEPTLSGVAQQLCVNFNATSPSSGVVNVFWEWTEE